MSTPITFNANWYLSQNPDVAAAIETGAPFNAFEHFTLYGRAEGRSASPLFDSQQYLANNPDVVQAVAQGLITAWDHFELFGGAEGRAPTPLFNEAFYLQQNPDVAAAIEQGLIASAAQHFVLFGQNEPRAINPFIDLGRYLNANPDLDQAGLGTSINAFQHLLQYGINEGRPLGNGVSLEDFSNDPGFTQALANGNPTAAMMRVGDVAPFIPTFERPAGWTPPANTPIPVDFVPPANSSLKLKVPSEVVVPPGTELPSDAFEPADPVNPVNPVDPVDPPPPVLPTFTVTESQAGVVTFANGSGDIEISITDGTATFVRGGQTATTTVAEINTKTIDLAAAQTLAINSAEMTALAGVTLTGAGTLKVTEPVTIAQLEGFGDHAGFTGAATFSIEDNASHLAAANDIALEAATAITVTDAATVAQMSAIVVNGADLSTTTYTLVDSATNLAAEDDTLVVQGASAITVTGTATIVEIAAIIASCATLDVITYSISDTVEWILAEKEVNGSAAGSILGGAAAIATSNMTMVDLTVSDAETLVTLDVTITNGYIIEDTIAAADAKDFSAISWPGLKGVTLTGSAGNQAVKGSSFADFIAGGDGADSLWGGDGEDMFAYTSVVDSAASVAANKTITFDAILDFTSGEDKIALADLNVTLTGGAKATSVHVTTFAIGGGVLVDHIGTFADLAGQLVGDLTGSVANGALQVYILDLTGNNGALGTGKYLLVNNNNTGMDTGDLFIQLAGTSNAPVAGDFVL